MHGEGLARRGVSASAGRSKEGHPGLALELALAPSGANRETMLEDAMVEYLQDHQSNHGFKAIDATLRPIRGTSRRVWDLAAAELEEGDVSVADARARLDDSTDKRHRVIHRGKPPMVYGSDARKCGKLIQELILAIDHDVQSLLDGSED